MSVKSKPSRIRISDDLHKAIVKRVLDATAHMTPKEIADQTYVCAQTIKNWRSGATKTPHLLTVECVARIVDMSVMLVTADERALIEAHRGKPAPNKRTRAAKVELRLVG